ncbi:MAG: TonB-dependent receptor [Deltaproteobacteria bacterium]|nr:TonB-dependent receptor [Deltaproteobacteria bacterium]
MMPSKFFHTNMACLLSAVLVALSGALVASRALADDTADDSDDTGNAADDAGNDAAGSLNDGDSAIDGLGELPAEETPIGGEGDAAMLDFSLEELLATPVEVWSASKTEETVETAPSIIEVVTAREISFWGYQSVAEVLQHMLGFYIIDDHILPNAVVRGVSGGLAAESGIIKVMIDGRHVVFRTTSGNWLGPELIPITAIERIEVIRGPASALYGADAFLGTVNIVLKTPEDLSGYIAHVSIGDGFDSVSNIMSLDRKLEMSAGTQKNNWGFQLSYGNNIEDRNNLPLPDSSPAPLIPTYNANDRISQHLVQQSRVAHFLLSYEKPERGYIHLSGYTSSIQRAGQFSRWTQFSDGLDEPGRKNATTIGLMQGFLGLDGELRVSDTLTLDLAVTYFDGRPTDDDRIEVASDLFYIRRNYRFQGINTVLEANWSPLERLTFIGGMELVFDQESLAHHDRVDKISDSVIGHLTASETSKQFVNPAIYLQANSDIVPNFWKLTGGVRMDLHNIYGTRVTGRAGSVFIWSKNFTTKLLYGSAFKAPSPTLLYAVPLLPGDVVGNDKLKPQYVHTFELSPSIRLNKNISMYAAAAHSIILDKAEFVPEGANITAQNVSRVRTYSVETGVDVAFENILAGYLSMEIQRAEREQPYADYRTRLIGTENIVAPSWIVRAGASYALPFSSKLPLRLGSRVMMVGERRASGQNIVERGTPYLLPAYLMWDGFLATDGLPVFTSGLTTFRFNVYNIANATAADPGFAGVDYPILGRRFTLEVTQTF